ncbi:MAG: CHAP domain-containing protein, partial [Clostridiales bacterium]|nr:CHAP domain-containing protein [Clostridiales bacterium]
MRILAMLCIASMVLTSLPAALGEEAASSSSESKETKKEETKKEEPKKEEPKKEEAKQEEPKKEEPKQEESKKEEKPAEAPSATEAPKVTEAPKPTEAPAATEAPKPAETQGSQEKPTEAPATADAPTAQPSETAHPGSSDAETTPAPTVTEQPTNDPTDTAVPGPTEVATDVPVESPLPEDSAEPQVSQLKVSAKATSQYGVVGGKSVSFSLSMSGGLAPYTVSIKVTAGGSTVYSSSTWQDSVSVTPKSTSGHKISVHVKDALGNEASDSSATIPVSSTKSESRSSWEKTIPKLKDGMSNGEKLIAVARSQLGYTESKSNFVIDESGNKQGYTRYGDWYGATYAEWCAMFICFCLSYAGISESTMPRDSTCQTWAEKLGSDYMGKSYTPKAGDIIFFHHDRANSNYINHVGIVTSVKGDTVYTIEGNSGKTVREKSYGKDDSSILGYSVMPEKHEPTVSIYFVSDDKGTLIKLEKCAMAVPNDGYVFAYWTRESGEVVYTDATLSTTVGGVYTAHYVSEEENVHQAIEKAIEEYGWQDLKG